MGGIFELVGPNRAVSIFGVKLILTIVLAAVFWLPGRSLRCLATAPGVVTAGSRTTGWSSCATDRT